MLGFVKVDRKERFLFSDSLLRVTLFFSEKCGPCVAPRAISNCFGRVFYFFLSLVNKYCLTHSFWWFLGSKKKKKAYVSVLTTYSGRCLLFFHNNLPQTSNCLGDCKLSKDNLSRLVLQHSPLILILKMFFRRQLEILNPQDHCWKTFNLTSFTCTPILYTDCMKMSYYSVLKIDVESSNIP